MKTRIEIIIGCMFSGKSTELIRRCNRYGAIGKKQLIINHTLDVRAMHNTLKTHDGVTSQALMLTNLMDLVNNKQYRDVLYSTEIIGIDEGQFYPDIVSSFLFRSFVRSFLRFFFLGLCFCAFFNPLF